MVGAERASESATPPAAAHPKCTNRPPTSTAMHSSSSKLSRSLEELPASDAAFRRIARRYGGPSLALEAPASASRASSSSVPATAARSTAARVRPSPSESALPSCPGARATPLNRCPRSDGGGGGITRGSPAQASARLSSSRAAVDGCDAGSTPGHDEQLDAPPRPTQCGTRHGMGEPGSRGITCPGETAPPAAARREAPELGPWTTEKGPAKARACAI